MQGFDIETRIAAVSSLAAVAITLINAQTNSSSSSSSSHGSSKMASLPATAAGAPTDLIAVLAEVVCPTLLAALEDYTR
jgi:hypothetical protein